MELSGRDVVFHYEVERVLEYRRVVLVEAEYEARYDVNARVVYPFLWIPCNCRRVPRLVHVFKLALERLSRPMNAYFPPHLA